MPTNPKLANLIVLLKQATEGGRLRWETTPDENTFRVLLGSGFMRLSKSFGTAHPMETSYTLTILDHNGLLVDEYTPEEGEDYFQLADLFGIARRSALNLEAVLDQMLQELKTRAG